jgi:chemotaxis family two-component system response regulator PixH
MLRLLHEIKILVIAADVDFHLRMESYLEDCGIIALAATDVVQAGALAVQEHPNLIVFDVNLPGGEGFVGIDRLRANLLNSNIPVIVVATQITPQLEATARSHGAETCLQKPVQKDILIDSLRRILARPPT